jgi:hypothetical protein
MMFWLSFCDNTRPRGRRFLGVAIVEVFPPFEPKRRPLEPVNNAMACAIERAWQLGINPGGEVGSMAIPPEHEERLRPYLDRLLSRDELDATGF